MSLLQITDVDFETRVLRSARPVLVLFSLEDEGDLKMSRIIARIAEERHDAAEFFIFKLRERPECAKRYGVSAAPVLLFFVAGNPVAKLAGLHPRDSISEKLDMVLARPANELPVLDAKTVGARASSFDAWQMAVGSGLFAGIVFALALHKLHGALALMVPAAAAGFFIFNGNLRLSGAQKALAVAIMVVVGLFGPELLRLAYAK